MAQPSASTPEAASREKAELTIVIVSYQCRDLLLRCLASLDDDPDRALFDVVVVENASTDGTSDAVASRFPPVQVLDAGSNRGFSAANNLALRQASGRHLLLLNPDTVVPSGALRAALAELDARPEVGMLGVKLVREDGSLDHACKRGFPTPLNALAYFTRVSRLLPRHPKLAGYTAGNVGQDEVAYVDAVNGAFMLVRRDALAEVGLLDEGYWLYMEDIDWCYRFWQAGWKILYWPVVSVLHAKAGSSGENRGWSANRAFHRGMWRFYVKHYRPHASSLQAVAVYLGIHGKLALSATVSSARRGSVRG